MVYLWCPAQGSACQAFTGEGKGGAAFQQKNRGDRPVLRHRRLGPSTSALQDAEACTSLALTIWQGPAKIVSLEQFNAFSIQSLGSNIIKKVHASRLLHYSDSKLEVTEKLESHVVDEDSKLHFVDNW